jgi:hypothetical protein
MNIQAKNFIIKALLKYQPAKTDLRSREENDGIIIIDSPAVSSLLRKKQYLNRVAAEIFRLCDGKTSIEKIISAMHQHYPEIKKPQMALEIIHTIRKLQASGALLKNFTS